MRKLRQMVRAEACLAPGGWPAGEAARHREAAVSQVGRYIALVVAQAERLARDTAAWERGGQP